MVMRLKGTREKKRKAKKKLYHKRKGRDRAIGERRAQTFWNSHDEDDLIMEGMFGCGRGNDGKVRDRKRRRSGREKVVWVDLCLVFWFVLFWLYLQLCLQLRFFQIDRMIR